MPLAHARISTVIVLIVLVSIATAGAQTWTENFETGIPADWDSSGLWHATSSCDRPGTCDPAQWAFFGIDASCNYDTGGREFGTLMTPVFTVPFNGTLRYCSAYEEEGSPSFDTATVEVDDFTSVAGPYSTNLTWSPAAANLAAYRGQKIRLVWSFDTVDAAANGYFGWAIDTVVISDSVTGDVLRFENFGGSSLPSNWMATGLWHVASSCGAISGSCNVSPSWAYFGQDATCNYATGAPEYGELISPVISVPENGATVTFCSALERESGGLGSYDIAELQVRTVVDGPLGSVTNGAWERRSASLGKFAGDDVRLLFRFDTGDAALNDFQGWQIDDVVVEKGRPASYVGTDWNGPDEQVFFFDSDLRRIGGFDLTFSPTWLPAGVTTDGSTVWVLDAYLDRVYSFDFDGNLIGIHTLPSSVSGWAGIAYLEALDLIAIHRGDTHDIECFDRNFGIAFTINSPSLYVPGLTADGDSIWIIDFDWILQLDFGGFTLASLPNPAAGEVVGGSSLALGGPNTLIVSSESGQWWEFDKTTGAVMRSGLTDLETMTGLSSIPAPVFVAAQYNNQTVHLLNRNLERRTSFTVGSVQPNAIATDGSTIWTGHFGNSVIEGYDLGGNLRFSWNANTNHARGIAYIEEAHELAVAEDDLINFYEPLTGTFIRSILAPLWPTGNTEGIAGDGSTIWCIVYADLKQIDIYSGAILATIPNAASGEAYGGTAIATGENGTLYLGSGTGNWWQVYASTGAVLRAGNNGILMTGLGRLPTDSLMFVRGDANDDGMINIADAVFSLTFLFVSGAETPHCERSLDVNDDGAVNIADPVYLLATLFTGGAAPSPPHPSCGTDPTPDLIGCESFSSCP